MRVYKKINSKRIPMISGFVLIMTLFYMQFLALLSISALTQIVEKTKENDNLISQKITFFTAQQVLIQIEEAWMNQNNMCMIPVSGLNELLLKPFSWWQEMGCYGNQNTFRYYFVVESLSSGFCTMTEDDRKANYYRITLLLIGKKNKDRFLMQSTVAKSGAMNAHECHQEKRIIHSGRQSIAFI